jgi:hypothetical protein
MGSDKPKFLSVSHNCWSAEEKVSVEENEALALSFTREELDEVLKSTKTAMALGQDGFPLAFYKKFWSLLKDLVF